MLFGGPWRLGSPLPRPQTDLSDGAPVRPDEEAAQGLPALRRGVGVPLRPRAHSRLAHRIVGLGELALQVGQRVKVDEELRVLRVVVTGLRAQSSGRGAFCQLPRYRTLFESKKLMAGLFCRPATTLVG